MNRANDSSTEQMLKEACDWMSEQVVDFDHSSFEEEKINASKKRGLPSLGEMFNRLSNNAKKILPFDVRMESKGRNRARASGIDSAEMHRVAVGQLSIIFRNPEINSFGDIDDFGVVVDKIQEKFGWQEEAGGLAKAWLTRSTRATWEKFKMEAESITALVGAAAAIAVVVLVLWARRGRSTQGESTVLAFGSPSPSSDFVALQKLSSGTENVAELASRLVAETTDPWSFNLENAINDLTINERRVLLNSLAKDRELSIRVIMPNAGEVFDSQNMYNEQVSQGGVRWVVMEPATEVGCGYARGTAILLKASVEVCTADWWCLVGLGDCPIGGAIQASSERYTGLDEEYARFWTASQGLSSFADLRAEFDERTLDVWREEFVLRLCKFYPSDDSKRVPIIRAPKPGDRFDASVMKAINGRFEVDAQVVSIEEKDGTTQKGLGCVGASPILYALVQVEEV